MLALYIFVPTAVSHGRSWGQCADLAMLARDGSSASEEMRVHARRQADLVIVGKSEAEVYWRAGNCQTKFRHEEQPDPLMWDDCASTLVEVDEWHVPDEKLGVVHLK